MLLLLRPNNSFDPPNSHKTWDFLALTCAPRTPAERGEETEIGGAYVLSQGKKRDKVLSQNKVEGEKLLLKDWPLISTRVSGCTHMHQNQKMKRCLKLKSKNIKSLSVLLRPLSGAACLDNTWEYVL